MIKRIAFIGTILSLIPLGQPLLIKTGVVLSSSAVMLSLTQKVNAETFTFYFNRAYAKAEEGDYYGAISDYTKSIEINPSEGAYYNRGILKRNLNDFSGAISDYTKAIEINPKKDEAYFNRGNAKTALKDYYGAISDYTKAIEIRPAVDAYNNRANRKVNIEDYYGAISDFNRALEMNPYSEIVFKNRGIAKEYLGDMKGACDDWRKAFSLGFEKAKQWVINQC